MLKSSKTFFTVRPGTQADLPELFALEQAVFPSEAYSVEKLRAMLADEWEGTVLVAERLKTVLGYGAVAVRSADEVLNGNLEPVRRCGIVLRGDSRVGYLKSLAVTTRPSVRRRGIGTALVLARIDWLVNRGVRSAFAYAWPGGFFLELAKKNGFQLISAWRGKRYNDGSFATLCYLNLDSRNCDEPQADQGIS